MTGGNAGTASAICGNAAVHYGNAAGTALKQLANGAESIVRRICSNLIQTLSDVLSVHIFFSPSHTFFHSFLHI
ncbi:MAG: hypothetical protein AB2L14_24250 [Candidatus Xenobiia bacterium LiM19]